MTFRVIIEARRSYLVEAESVDGAKASALRADEDSASLRLPTLLIKSERRVVEVEKAEFVTPSRTE